MPTQTPRRGRTSPVMEMFRPQQARTPPSRPATMQHLMAFALAGAPQTGQQTEGMVTRPALLFRAQYFADREWGMTPEEVQAAVASFQGPGYVEIEHFSSHNTPSILDGHLGHLERVWASEDGQELYGAITLPAWLDTIAMANGGKLSAVFTRDEKRLVGVGLVLHPQVPEAALLDAFVSFARARHDTPHGQQALQDMHDRAVTYGATCRVGTVAMASWHEGQGIQGIHDMAVQHGARCQGMAQAARPQARASPLAALTRGTTERTQTGTVKEMTVADNKNPAQLQAELEDLRAQHEANQRALVTLQQERRVERADLWADKMVTEGHIFPAERPLLVELHVMAATDDDTSGLVTFADGNKKSRLATLLAAVDIRPSHGLTQEQIAANPEVVVLLNRQRTKTAEEAEKGTPEENDNLLAKTDAGRLALARRRQANGR